MPGRIGHSATGLRRRRRNGFERCAGTAGGVVERTGTARIRRSSQPQAMTSALVQAPSFPAHDHRPSRPTKSTSGTAPSKRGRARRLSHDRRDADNRCARGMLTCQCPLDAWLVGLRLPGEVTVIGGQGSCDGTDRSRIRAARHVAARMTIAPQVMGREALREQALRRRARNRSRVACAPCGRRMRQGSRRRSRRAPFAVATSVPRE